MPGEFSATCKKSRSEILQVSKSPLWTVSAQKFQKLVDVKSIKAVNLKFSFGRMLAAKLDPVLPCWQRLRPALA